MNTAPEPGSTSESVSSNPTFSLSRSPGLPISGWRAALAMRFVAAGPRTVMTDLAHHGPLRVLRTYHPQADGTCHAYLVHPPGGLVGGDRVEIDVEVAAGARALITTPAAGKLYRSDHRLAEQHQRCRVGDGASLDWLPQENIYFAGSWSHVVTRVELAPGATFVGWDLTVLGRPAAGERFTTGSARQSFELHRAGRPLWIERARHDGGSPALGAAWGLAGHPVSGVLAAVGAGRALGALVPAVRERLHAAAPGAGASLAAVTLAGDDQSVLVCRLLAAEAEDVRRAFVPIWTFLREALVGSAPAVPRVWAT
jgi:urease accessory protein